MKNYYQILQVDKDADLEIIQRIFKYHIKKNHPDLFQGDEKLQAEKRVKELNEAYDIISDSQKRKEYDEQLENEQTQEKEQDMIHSHPSFERLQLENEVLKNQLTEKETLLNKIYQEFNLGTPYSIQEEQIDPQDEVDYNDTKSIAKHYVSKLKIFLFKLSITLVLIAFGFIIISFLTNVNVLEKLIQSVFQIP